MKQCSEDEIYDLIFDFSIGAEENQWNFSIQDMFVAGATIKIWIGMVLENDMENKDLQIKLMHPALASHSFYWKEEFKNIDVSTTPNGRIFICPKGINHLCKKLYKKQFSLYMQQNLVHSVVKM